MKMYQHLDDLPNSLGKNAFFLKKKGIFIFPKNIIGWLLTLLASCLIWLCCCSLSKCIFNRWQLLKDQIFWTALIIITWYGLAALSSPTATPEKSMILGTTGDYLTSLFTRYLSLLRQSLKRLDINRNTKQHR